MITKEDVIQMGIVAEEARRRFEILGQQNTQFDAQKREEQTRQYEIARAEMWEKKNKHQSALEKLGRT